jgi:hypothetical protein
MSSIVREKFSDDTTKPQRIQLLKASIERQPSSVDFPKSHHFPSVSAISPSFAENVHVAHIEATSDRSLLSREFPLLKTSRVDRELPGKHPLVDRK